MRAKPILLGLGVTLLALTAVLVVAVNRIDPAAYLPVAVAKVKELTGRELKVDGGIGYSLSLVPKLSIESVRFQNASWGSRPDMLLAKRVEVQIALLPLLSGRIDI
ncbi:MAG: AsmA family protein, partial [Phycisphaerales bacterium]|nr:AsmA family protein [Phycisphaerales bacterium]